jgi:hypothetical protein
MGMRRLLPLVLLLAVLTACGDDGTVESTATDDPDTPVSSPAVSDTTGPDAPAWARIEPTEDLVDPTPATPDEVLADPDDPSAVLVHFYGGVQECFGARATAAESATEVRIRLELGGQPDAGDQACIEIAEAQELVVALDAPLGDRELVAEPGDRG